MGLIINSIHNSGSFSRHGNGFIPLAAKASKKCLEEVKNFGITPGLLISTALHNESFIVEPAISSLILGNIIKKRWGRNMFKGQLSNIFTFDLSEGSNGYFHAIQTLQSFIQEVWCNHPVKTCCLRSKILHVNNVHALIIVHRPCMLF